MDKFPGSRYTAGLLAILVLLTGILPAGCSCTRGFDSMLNDAARPYRFSVIGWEAKALGSAMDRLFMDEDETISLDTADITVYFEEAARRRQLDADIKRMKTDVYADTALLETAFATLNERQAAATDAVEAFLETQLREMLARQGIHNPVTSGNTGFPPVNFELADMPHLLIVSPRDRIESIREITLLPEMTVAQMEDLERQVDALGVSSVVEPLGGLSTYPSLVMDSGNLHFVLSVAAEEWLHQYLVFKPLGFRYVLDLAGLRRDYDIATMNETLAGIVSKEIGGLIYDEYYAPEDAEDTPAPSGGFDYYKEMRITRLAVDEYLARGEVEQAEQYMEERRQFMTDNGYYIRKLNQAYFAFHGAYAYRPDSVSPIGAEMRELRVKSDSLQDFLETAAAMTGREDLTAALQE